MNLDLALYLFFWLRSYICDICIIYVIFFLLRGKVDYFAASKSSCLEVIERRPVLQGRR